MIPQLPIKKRNILRNDDPNMYVLYPGWAGVDGGTYRKSEKKTESCNTTKKAIVSACLLVLMSAYSRKPWLADT